MEKYETQQMTARWETATRYYIAVLQVDLLGDWIVTTANGGGKSAQGGRTAKMFDPDKSDKAMKSGLLEHCQRYIRERTGQRQLFAVQQDK